MKQKNPINKMCQHRSVCLRDAILGVFTWAGAETDVNLNSPVKVYCGQHKPRLHRGWAARNVKLVRS